jgi:hypothetical protein
MRRKIVTAAVAASIAAGSFTGVAMGAPALAGAVDSAAAGVSWVQEALGGLVADGTISQAQADAVEAALDDACPADGLGRGRGGPGGRVDLAAVASSLGISEEEVRAALDEGRSLADLATAAGVDVQAVIDAIVAVEAQHLEEHVAAGELTREDADARLADAEERAAAIVDGDVPVPVGRPHRVPSGHPAASPAAEGSTDQAG